MSSFVMTKKYRAAVKLGQELKFTTAQLGQTNIDLYWALDKLGYYWHNGQWTLLLDEPADKATNLIRVRVWAAGDVVEEIAGQIAQNLGGWLELVERSEPYPCRPPKQMESRVYLTLKLKEAK